MGLRQRRWARAAAAALLALLGGKCTECGTRGTKKNGLQFDCVVPCGMRHHRMEWSHRISFYRAQHRQGNLQILCKVCNGRKGQREWMAATAASSSSSVVGVL